MGVSGKTSKVSAVVAALCIVIYIGAIAFGTLQIVKNIGERRNLAETEFQDLTDTASSSAVILGFMSEPYQQTIRDFLAASKTLLGAIISASGNEYAFERESGRGIVWAGTSPRLKIGPGLLDKSLPLRIDGQRYVNIYVVYSYLDYGFLLMVLRNILLAVLAALAIAFITLLVEMIRKNRGIYYRSAAPGAEVKVKQAGPKPAPGIKPSAKFSAAPAPAKEQSEKEQSKAPLPELELPPEDEEAETRNPQGLFTTRGNVGWEAYLHDRLSSELHRCASSEQDLVFLVMEFKVLRSISDSQYRQFAGEAVSFFTMRDLIFEMGENGISIIIPGADLEHGISRAEEFRSRISARLPETFEGRSSLCGGLSSRSGRLIEADRLMLEASRALEKALEDPVSPIVAFKSDPEKYRDFIKAKG